MNRLKKLMDKQSSIATEMDTILGTADKESRDLTKEETDRFAALEAEATQVSKSIERERKLQETQLTEQTTNVLNEFADDAVITQVIKAPQYEGCFGDFATNVFNAGLQGPSKVTEKFTGYQKAINGYMAATGMNATIGSEGGFLLPSKFSNEIWDGLQGDDENLLNMTDGYTLTNEESIEFNANAETNRTTGNRWGGARAYWLSEAGQMTSSQPKFRKVKLEPKQLGVLVYATDKLLRGSGIALSQYLTKVATAEIGFMVSDAIINGDGVGKPKGIMAAGPVIPVTKETGQAADTIVKENIDKMWSRCHARARNGAVWFINQDCEPQLDSLAMSVGTGGLPVYLPANGISASPYASLKGRPVRPIEFCQTVGDAGDIILANLAFYATAVRGGIDSAMSIHLKFDYNETAFRFLFEVDGQPWLASAITPYKGSNTLSPFVSLAARA